jgi:hypothetical protein
MLASFRGLCILEIIMYYLEGYLQVLTKPARIHTFKTSNPLWSIRRSLCRILVQPRKLPHGLKMCLRSIFNKMGDVAQQTRLPSKYVQFSNVPKYAHRKEVYTINQTVL